jgi:hypothetical protein
MRQPDHIFIVGLPRTGTTLTQALLNRSKDIQIAQGESHFLTTGHRRGFWNEAAKVGDISTDDGAKCVVDYIYQQKDTFWLPITSKVGRDEFLAALLHSDRSSRALFDLAVNYAADGKPIRGEKSPGHIFFVPTLLEWFPHAKIIHTFRDPRAVYVSQYRKKAQKGKASPIAQRLGAVGELYTVSGFIRFWLRVVDLHRRYQRQYADKYLLSRYEDLIAAPQSSVEKLCRFLGVEFSHEMLEQQVSINSSFVPHNELPGFDVQAIDRWKNYISPLASRWFLLWCKRELREFGYPI